jgi:hypothetical protein
VEGVGEDGRGALKWSHARQTIFRTSNRNFSPALAGFSLSATDTPKGKELSARAGLRPGTVLTRNTRHPRRPGFRLWRRFPARERFGVALHLHLDWRLLPFFNALWIVRSIAVPTISAMNRDVSGPTGKPNCLPSLGISNNEVD